MRLAAIRHGPAWTRLDRPGSTGAAIHQSERSRRARSIARRPPRTARDSGRSTIGWRPRVSPRDADRCTPPDERAHHHSLPDGLPNRLLISWVLTVPHVRTPERAKRGLSLRPSRQVVLPPGDAVLGPAAEV